MRGFVRSVLVVLILAPVWMTSAHAQEKAAAQEPSDSQNDALLDTLHALDARLDEVTSMRAEFTQKRIIPMLRRPMESRGTLLWAEGAVRWDTLKPAPSVMVVREDEIRIYTPEARMLEIYELGGSALDQGQPGVAKAGANPRLAQLTERFTIREIPANAFDDPPKGEMLGLELTPIDDELAQEIERVLILIEVAVPMARRVRIESADGEVTDIALDKLRFEPAVTEREMTIDVPPGTEITKPLKGGLEGSREPVKPGQGAS